MIRRAFFELFHGGTAFILQTYSVRLHSHHRLLRSRPKHLASFHWQIHINLSVTDCMWKRTCPYKLMERETHRHTHRNCPGSPGFVNYFPLKMNQPAAVWSLWLPPNQTVIWLGGESGRVERRGKLFHFGPTASASLRLNDPSDSKCQNVPQQHLLPPALSRLSLQYFPEVHKSCVFLFFMDADNRK